MNKNSKVYLLQRLIDNQNWLKQELAKSNPNAVMVEHYEQMMGYYSQRIWGK
jgi:hypothetical protein